MKNNQIKKFHKNNKGLSLVELIVAVAILSIAIGPLLYSFVFSARMNARAKTKQRATTAAQTVMEQLKAYDLEDVYNMFAVTTDSYGNTVHIDPTPFLASATGVDSYSTTAASTGFGNYKITKMSVSDSSTEIVKYDVDFTLTQGKTSTVANLNVFDPDKDVIYTQYSEAGGGSYAYDPYYVATQCVAASGVEQDLIKSINVDRKTTLSITDTVVSVVYSFDYKIYDAPGLSGTVLANGSIAKSVVASDSLTSIRDVYYYYYPAYSDMLGTSSSTTFTINCTNDYFYIRNKASNEVNVYVYKQIDSAKSVYDLINSESTYKLKIHADNSTEKMTNIYDCVHMNLGNKSGDFSMLDSTGLNYDSDLVKNLVSVKPDKCKSEVDTLTYYVDIKVYDPKNHTAGNELVSMTGTVVK